MTDGRLLFLTLADCELYVTTNHYTQEISVKVIVLEFAEVKFL